MIEGNIGAKVLSERRVEFPSGLEPNVAKAIAPGCALGRKPEVEEHEGSVAQIRLHFRHDRSLCAHRLLAVGLCDLPDQLGPGHVHRVVDGGSLGPGVVLEDFQRFFANTTLRWRGKGRGRIGSHRRRLGTELRQDASQLLQPWRPRAAVALDRLAQQLDDDGLVVLI
ncbi:MAG: hypothetical protein WA459_18810 [Stellaceae bacterium]